MGFEKVAPEGAGRLYVEAGFGAQPRERDAILASRSHDRAIMDDDGPPEAILHPILAPGDLGPRRGRGGGLHFWPWNPLGVYM